MSSSAGRTAIGLYSDHFFTMLKLHLYRVAQKTKLSYFGHIFAKYLPIFTIFSPVDSVRNLLFTGMPITPTMSLHYLVNINIRKPAISYSRRSNGKLVHSKIVKLYEKMFSMSSIVLDNSFKTLSPFIDAPVNKNVCDSLFHQSKF